MKAKVLNRRPRVLLYSDCYIYGGSERLNSSLLRSQELRRNFELKMAYRDHRLYREGIAADYTEQQLGDWTIPLMVLSNDTLFFVLGSRGIPSVALWLLKLPFRLLDHSGLYALFNCFRFLLLLARFRPEIVHVNNGGFPGARSCTQMALLAVALGFPVVYQVNNWAEPRKGWLDRIVDGILAGRCRFVTASAQARDFLVERRLIPTQSISRVFNAPPEESVRRDRVRLLDEFRVPEGAKIVAEVAFLSERKGQRHLLEAFRILRDQGIVSRNGLVLFLVGGGEDEPELRRFVAKHQLEAVVKLTGYRPDSVDFIAHSDLFVLPSVSREDMPLVLLTAMKLGRRILATRLAGIEEAIEDGVSGVLVDPDPETLAGRLATRMVEMLESADDSLERAAKARYEEFFSPHARAEAMGSIYGGLLAAREITVGASR